jgi:hypothetical protein
VFSPILKTEKSEKENIGRKGRKKRHFNENPKL